MVYHGKFLHFMVRGGVGQYFQRAGGRPARARRIAQPCWDQQRCHGITCWPSICHAQVGAAPEHPSIVARSLDMSADSYSRSLRTFYIG
jgi:hypothetical protein